jgi:hypothetical protein
MAKIHMAKTGPGRGGEACRAGARGGSGGGVFVAGGLCGLTLGGGGGLTLGPLHRGNRLA